MMKNSDMIVIVVGEENRTILNTFWYLFCPLQKGLPTLFLYLILTLEHTNQTEYTTRLEYLNQITYKLPLLIKQSGEVELDIPTLLSI